MHAFIFLLNNYILLYVYPKGARKILSGFRRPPRRGSAEKNAAAPEALRMLPIL